MSCEGNFKNRKKDIGQVSLAKADGFGKLCPRRLLASIG
jgi:hypothetical protein